MRVAAEKFKNETRQMVKVKEFLNARNEKICIRREDALERKSGEEWFVEAMEALSSGFAQEGTISLLKRFEKPASMGHEESVWLWSLIEPMMNEGFDITDEKMVQTFANTGNPLGYYFAANWSCNAKYVEYVKKSSDGGCIWGQLDYLEYVNGSLHGFDRVDEELLDKLLLQDNRRALLWKANMLLDEEENIEKALLYYEKAAKLGCESSMFRLSELYCGLYPNNTVEIDFLKALKWVSLSAEKKSVEYIVTAILEKYPNNETVDPDSHILALELGKVIYWSGLSIIDGWKDFVGYYAQNVILQQEAIFQFLHFWNTIIGVKPVGTIIAQMVWNENVPITAFKRTEFNRTKLNRTKFKRNGK